MHNDSEVINVGGIDWEFWMSRLYWYLRNDWFEYLLLAIDAVFLLRYSLAKKLRWKTSRRVSIQAVLVLSHLVLGALALWFDNRDAFNIVTVLFLGTAILLNWVKPNADEKGQDSSESIGVRKDNP